MYVGNWSWARIVPQISFLKQKAKSLGLLAIPSVKPPMLCPLPT